MTGSVKEIALAELHFDPLNPRLPSTLREADDLPVLKYLLLESNLVELMQSIGEKGYFNGEPLLVVPRPGDSGYWVVEGNRRLGALKLLASDVPAPIKPREVEQARGAANHKPTMIPVLEFKDRSDILGYLGYRHITGIKEWSPLAKARYLKQLREQYADDDHASAHKALARTIGSKSTNVAKLLTGLSLLELARDRGLLNEIRQTEDDIDFSLLTTGIGYEGIQSFIGLNGIADVELGDVKEGEFSEFFRWVFDRRGGSTVLGESRKFKELNKVVVHAEALAAVRRGESIDTAFLYTSGPLEALRRFMMDAEKSLKAAQDATTHATGLEETDVTFAQRVARAAQNLHVSLKASVAEDSSDVDA